MKRTPATIIGIGVMCLGGILFFVTPVFFPYHIIGIMLIMAGPMVTARLRGTPAGDQVANAYALAYVRQWRNLKRTWPIGAAVSATLLFSFYLLQRDASEGYQQVFPVYFFAGSGLVLMTYVLHLSVPRQN